MNVNGVEWCESNKAQIVEHMVWEGQRRGWAVFNVPGVTAITKVVAGRLVDQAIKQASEEGM
jgi:hypothetical protein